jgi:hypothetical protein
VLHCPKCHSKNLRRSATRSRWERWRKEITGKCPYRCRECNWRGWKSFGGLEDERTSPQAVVVADPPNLRGTSLARATPRIDLDLKELDRFDDVGKNDG